MRNIVWCTLLFLALVPSLWAQEKVNIRPYKVWIDNAYGPTMIGELTSVGENTLRVLPGFYSGYQRPGDLHQLNIPAVEIRRISLRRKGKVGRGILLGAATGVVTGVIIGLIAGDDPSCGYDPNNPSTYGHLFGTLCEGTRMTAGEKAALAGTGLGLLGGVAGAIIGSIKIKIPINGNKDLFEFNRDRLMDYAGGK